MLVVATPNMLKFGRWLDQTDQNVGTGQTKGTKMCVSVRPNTRAEVSTLKNAKLCKIGVECVEFM